MPRDVIPLVAAIPLLILAFCNALYNHWHALSGKRLDDSLPPLWAFLFTQGGLIGSRHLFTPSGLEYRRRALLSWFAFLVLILIYFWLLS